MRCESAKHLLEDMTMLITKDRYDREMAAVKYDVNRLNNLYWDLFEKYNLLLEHLKLNEQVIPEKRVLISKGSPERG